MYKATLLILTGLLFVGLNCIHTSDVLAQTDNASMIPKTCTGRKFVMPASISVNNEALSNFLGVAELPRTERVVAFNKLPNEQKASFFKVLLALQFVKRPDMTREQNDFILESISKISPDLYDKGDLQKVALAQRSNEDSESRIYSLFPRKIALELLEGLGTSKSEEIRLVQKYEDLLKTLTKSRMKTVKEMPVTDRINIWKVQSAYHLATGSFSKVQSEFILGMMASLSPDSFAPRSIGTREVEIKEAAKVMAPIFQVFTKEEGFAIFMTVGIQKYVKDESSETNEFGSCNCLVSCELDGQYCGDEHGCISTTNGCGPWGTLGCHYLCQDI